MLWNHTCKLRVNYFSNRKLKNIYITCTRGTCWRHWWRHQTWSHRIRSWNPRVQNVRNCSCSFFWSCWFCGCGSGHSRGCQKLCIKVVLKRENLLKKRLYLWGLEDRDHFRLDSMILSFLRRDLYLFKKKSNFKDKIVWTLFLLNQDL